MTDEKPKLSRVRLRTKADKEAREVDKPVVDHGEHHHNPRSRSFPRFTDKELDAKGRNPTNVLSAIICYRCKYEGFVPFASRFGEKHLCADCFRYIFSPKELPAGPRPNQLDVPMEVKCISCKGTELINFSPVPADIRCRNCLRDFLKNERAKAQKHRADDKTSDKGRG